LQQSGGGSVRAALAVEVPSYMALVEYSASRKTSYEISGVATEDNLTMSYNSEIKQNDAGQWYSDYTAHVVHVEEDNTTIYDWSNDDPDGSEEWEPKR
jgi:hypothetical protein